MNDPVHLEDLRPKRSALWELVAFDLRSKPGRPGAVFPAARRARRGNITSGRGPDLAIDFGTSAIAAALVGGTYAVEILRFGDERLLAAPFGRRRALDRSRLSDNYELSYGYLGGAAPSRRFQEEYYPCLKRRIEHLARCRADTGWQSEAVLDVAAVTRLALGLARDEQGRAVAERLGDGFQVYITVPNAFPAAAIDVLRRGVGFGVTAALGRPRRPVVRALLEAEAVAYGAIAKPRLEAARTRTTLLVVDAGAGTTDATIVRAEGGELRVLAHVGLPVGGMDLDAFLAGLKGSPRSLSQRLDTVRQAKQHHLSETGVPLEEAFANLARDLVTSNGWPPGSGGRRIEDEIARAYERYMALAVRSLIRALPADEIKSLDEVVVSGRGSLLAGFQEAVRRSVAECGPAPEPRSADDPEDRKLAVVRGVAAYVASTYGTPGGSEGQGRRPARSSFEIFLRHEGDRELQLLPAGRPLDRGWGVAAWHQPPREVGSGPIRPRVEMRLVPREVLKSLAAEGAFSAGDLEELLRWAVLPVVRIDEKEPPYSARLDFDFLSLQAQLEVDGECVRTPDRAEATFGRRHPVHQLDDNWFELSQ